MPKATSHPTRTAIDCAPGALTERDPPGQIRVRVRRCPGADRLQPAREGRGRQPQPADDGQAEVGPEIDDTRRLAAQQIPVGQAQEGERQGAEPEQDDDRQPLQGVQRHAVDELAGQQHRGDRRDHDHHPGRRPPGQHRRGGQRGQAQLPEPAQGAVLGQAGAVVEGGAHPAVGGHAHHGEQRGVVLVSGRQAHVGEDQVHDHRQPDAEHHEGGVPDGAGQFQADVGKHLRTPRRGRERWRRTVRGRPGRARSGPGTRPPGCRG